MGWLAKHWRICRYARCRRLRAVPKGRRLSRQVARQFPWCAWHSDPANRETPAQRRHRILQETR